MSNAAVLDLKKSETLPRCFLESDFGEISSWWTKRNQHSPTREILPLHGRIIPGKAVGFLYKTDSAVAILDGFATNPEASESDRKSAMLKVAEYLVEDAKKAGIKILYGTTRNQYLISLAKKFGFHVENDPYFAIAKVF